MRGSQGSEAMDPGIRAWRWLVLLVLIAMAAFGRAQDPTYRLQPEDVLKIQVYNDTQINVDLPVGRDGNISAPFVGIIRAQGKTTSELEADLKALYIQKLKLRDPIVSVIVLAYARVKASIVGLVNRPGVYDMRPGDTILTLLSYAGGTILEGSASSRANLRRVTLRRKASNELIPIDLQAMLKRGDMSQNYKVEDGDELIVPEDTRNRVLVLGAVAQPGAFPYTEPMTVMDAIGLARGQIRYVSKFSEILVIREKAGMPGNYIRIRSDIVKFVKQGDAAQNFALEPGDVVYVPETKTPDWDRIANVVNSLFFLDRFFRDNSIFNIGR